MIPAARAYEMGLVNHVFASDELMAGARKLMGKILSKAPIAVSLSLEALRHADQPLEDGLRIEADLFGNACETEDFKEGVEAFLGKRKAEFKGR